MLKIKYKIVSLLLYLLLATTILAGCSNKQKDNEMSEEKSISKIENDANKELKYLKIQALKINTLIMFWYGLMIIIR